MKTTISGVYADDEIAAVLAAVSCALAEEADAPPLELVTTSSWRAAAKLEGQGLVAAPRAAGIQWGQATRAARAGRWSKGIVGS